MMYISCRSQTFDNVSYLKSIACCHIVCLLLTHYVLVIAVDAHRSLRPSDSSIERSPVDVSVRGAPVARLDVRTRRRACARVCSDDAML